MSSNQKQGMGTAKVQSAGWWEDINSGNIGQSSTDLIQKSKRQRGKVQKNAKNNTNNAGAFTTRRAADIKKLQTINSISSVPLVSLEQKSPLIWTIGTLVLYVIVFICELIQEGGIAPMSKNPLVGPSDETMIIMGAKYGPPIIAAEWWRFVTALFLHSGIIHLVLTVALKFCSCDVERDSGYCTA